MFLTCALLISLWKSIGGLLLLFVPCLSSRVAMLPVLASLRSCVGEDGEIASLVQDSDPDADSNSS